MGRAWSIWGGPGAGPGSIGANGQYEKASSSSNEEASQPSNFARISTERLIEVEDMLLQLELKDGTRPLTTKETRLYNEIRARLRELITALTNDLAREHSAA